jgi:hypothetical protein
MDSALRLPGKAGPSSAKRSKSGARVARTEDRALDLGHFLPKQMH